MIQEGVQFTAIC